MEDGPDSAWRNRHLGLTHTETRRRRLQMAYGQRFVDSKSSQTIPATNQHILNTLIVARPYVLGDSRRTI